MVRIRALREAKMRTDPNRARWTQAALAERVGVDSRTIRRWEGGVGMPTRFHQRQLAKMLGVPISDLGLGAPSRVQPDHPE